MNALKIRPLKSNRYTTSVLTAGIALVVTSAIWGVWFLYQKIWPELIVQLLGILLGLYAVNKAREPQAFRAMYLMYIFVFLEVSINSCISDIHDRDAPRTLHLLLLPTGVGVFIFFAKSKAWVQHVLALPFFLVFIVFSATNWGIYTPLTPDPVYRPWLAWFTSLSAVALLYLLFYLKQADFSTQAKLASALRSAIAQNQLELYYQPQATVEGHIVGAEALLRWKHPELGFVSPALFIPLAEKTGTILPIGQWVLGTACHQLANWAKNPETCNLMLAVNVSAYQFKQPDFVPALLSVIARSGANSKRLKLELTESLLVSDLTDIVDKMTLLKKEGILLSLDDFGTGYSSLSYLKKLPLDQLKIDKSFVDDIMTSPDAVAIAKTIIGLGISLRLDVIAEGVETEGQCETLMQLGCLAYQGYLLSRPLPLATFNELLMRNMQKPSEFAKSAIENSSYHKPHGHV